MHAALRARHLARFRICVQIERLPKWTQIFANDGTFRVVLSGQLSCSSFLVAQHVHDVAAERHTGAHGRASTDTAAAAAHAAACAARTRALRVGVGRSGGYAA